MAPNRRPPGNLMYSMASAERPDAVRRIASSTSEGSVAPRVDTTGSTVEPNSASPAGRPSTINSTRITCTIAIPRTSASNSADSAITCAIEPGLAPTNADKRSQCQAQVIGGGGHHADRRDDEQRDAQRPARNPLERVWCDHRPQQNTDQHEAQARERQRYLHGTARERGDRDRQHRA